MTTTTPDAVDVADVIDSILPTWQFLKAMGKKRTPAYMAEKLAALGFTITRTETEGIRHSAVADYLKDDKGLRPAMSEAELLLHCQSLAMEFADDNLRKDCEQAAFELAKKYRG